MWKRLQGNRAPRQPQIGASTLIETTLDEQAYPDLLDRNAGTPYTETTSGNAGQPRILPKDLPALPFSKSQLTVQELAFRPASSVYSEPSPNPQITQFPRDTRRDIDVVSVATPTTTYTGDVSPPSSPEIEPQQSFQNRDTVSPIQEDSEDSEQTNNYTAAPNRKPSSNIPILRREKRRNQFENTATDSMARNKTSAPKYDPYTGEPTTSGHGKVQNVKPSTFGPGDALGRGFGQQGMGTTTYITGVQKPHTSFSDRVRRLKENNLMIVNRPEWKGASGRQAVVKPVAEKPTSAPVVPARSPSRGGSPPNGSLGHNTPVSIVPSDHLETWDVSPTVKGFSPTFVPPIPARDSRRSPPINVVSSNSQLNLSSTMSLPLRSNPAYPSPANSDQRLGDQYNTPSANSQQLRKGLPTPTEEKPPGSSGMKRVESIERSFNDALKQVGSWEQPGSRFSITTYDPSTTASTPRGSIDIPTTPTQQSPILNRKRPQIGPIENHKATHRKAVGSTKSMSMSIASGHNSKDLPKTPGEAQSVDLIGSLQAQLDILARRRQILQRNIRQMTESIPADVGIRNSVVVQRRGEEKRNVESLKEELADVQAQEHELGLKLHRAWKRRDQQTVYEPTGLWVRRVTG